MGARSGRGRPGRGDSSGGRAGSGQGNGRMSGGAPRVGAAPSSGDVPSPPCLICRQRARTTSFRFLTHGVGVWLCATHGSTEFMRREGGRELVRLLTGAWTAAGALGFRRQAALSAHIQRLRSAIEGRDKPGSHTWPKLRREAERRFAAGEIPAVVIDELRNSHGGGPAIIPSIRTMRRWFAQGRWLISSVQFGPRRRQSLPPDPGESGQSDAAATTSRHDVPQRE